MLFASEGRGESSIDVKISNEDEVRVKTDVRTDIKSDGEIRARIKEEVRQKTADGPQIKMRIEKRGEIRQRIKNTLDTRSVDATLKRREAIEKARAVTERRCDSLDDATERAVCDKESVAYQVREKVRERHELSEACRNENNETQAACQERVNAEFKEEVQARFKAWVKERRERGENETNDELNEEVRTRLELVHEEMKGRLIERHNDTRQKAILNRLDNAIETAEKHGGLLERAITKAAEKGHDTAKLEFVLEAYVKAVDNAKVLYDDEQYRDSVASLNEAKELFKEFRGIFADIVSTHKRNELYVEAGDSNE